MRENKVEKGRESSDTDLFRYFYSFGHKREQKKKERKRKKYGVCVIDKKKLELAPP